MATATSRKALPLDASSRKETAAKLQTFLYNLISLRLGVQQVHWNIQGNRFYGVHTMLGEFYEALDHEIDEMAERILALGHPADGRPDRVAAESVLPASPEGFITIENGLTHLLSQYEAFDHHTEDTRAEVEDIDAVTHDMLVHVLELSQKQQWMIRSHFPSADAR